MLAYIAMELHIRCQLFYNHPQKPFRYETLNEKFDSILSTNILDQPICMFEKKSFGIMGGFSGQGLKDILEWGLDKVGGAFRIEIFSTFNQVKNCRQNL